MSNETEEDGTVTVSMEISGEYDEVVSKLRVSGSDQADFRPLLEDIEQLLETVVQMNGGTRSAIADRLSAETAVSFDAQAVVETLQVLSRYDYVVLDGNTWKPGPALQG